ncbi:hypothetical protein [Aerococcus urinaeequi]|uniref:hypothetical protein n=1 Tax=Aerococcus urinaeequi TaxID=51665 RepID=UPI003EC7A9E2
MQKYLNVESTERPEAVRMDSEHVYEAENIRDIEVTDENGNKSTQYKFNLTVYEKDEYILVRLDRDKANTDLAIAQIVTGLGGAM